MLVVEIADRHEGNIALLLTDVVLPKIGGPSLAKSLLQRRSGMKVLYMSGHANGAVFDSGVLKPGTAFLQKPFAARELSKKVRKLLDAPQALASQRSCKGVFTCCTSKPSFTLLQDRGDGRAVSGSPTSSSNSVR